MKDEYNQRPIQSEFHTLALTGIPGIANVSTVRISTQLGDRLALTVKVEHAFFLNHFRFVIGKFLVTFSPVLIRVSIKKALTINVANIGAVLYSILETAIGIYVSRIHLHRLLEIVVLEATESGQSCKNKTKQKEQTEEDPLQFLAEHEGAEDVIDLVLSPFRLPLDEGKGEEVAELRRDLRVKVLE